MWDRTNFIWVGQKFIKIFVLGQKFYPIEQNFSKNFILGQFFSRKKIPATGAAFYFLLGLLTHYHESWSYTQLFIILAIAEYIHICNLVYNKLTVHYLCSWKPDIHKLIYTMTSQTSHVNRNSLIRNTYA